MCSTGRHLQSSEAAVVELTRELLTAVNAHDYNNWVVSTRISSRFRGWNEGRAPQNANDYFQRYRNMCKENPGYRVEITEIMAEVDDHHGRAKVWVSVRVSNFRGNNVRAGVNLLTWRRYAGEWFCFSHAILRGLESYD